MRKETSAGAIVFFQKGKKREYLLLNYLGGHWDFPKGHIELYEKPEETVIREIKEETGLNVHLLKGFQEKITYTFKHRNEFIIKEVIFYLARAKNQKVKLSTEHKGYVWLPFNEALKLITFNKNLLKKAEFFLNKRKKQAGFTLVEILIVLGVILILLGLISQIFKPLVYFQKTRDIKRISDLKALDSALQTYIATIYSFENKKEKLFNLTRLQLEFELSDGGGQQTITQPVLGPPNTGVDEASSTIFISVPFDKEDVRNQTLVWNGKTYYFSQASSTEYLKNNGNGWVPVNLTILPYTLISSLPADPLNSFGEKFFYSYVFKRASSTFEINANLEYPDYRYGGSNDQTSIDNGDNPNIYEVGNDLNLMPNNLY